MSRSNKPSIAVTLCRAAAFAAFSGAAAAAETAASDFPDHLAGDLGGMVYGASTPVRGESSSALPLPYAYFDYKRFYARIDTVGIKGCRLGYGHIELAARVAIERIKADSPELRGINPRKNPLPVGIGTYQLTPVGAFFVYAFHDFGKSLGNLYEVTYAAKAEAGPFTFYPELGVEYRSKLYESYYYGVSDAESAASGYAAYRPNAGATPYVALFTEMPLTGNWYGTLRLRHDWLPAAAYDSPLLKAKTRDSAFVAVSYRFK